MERWRSSWALMLQYKWLWQFSSASQEVVYLDLVRYCQVFKQVQNAPIHELALF